MIESYLHVWLWLFLHECKHMAIGKYWDIINNIYLGGFLPHFASVSLWHSIFTGFNYLGRDTIIVYQFITFCKIVLTTVNDVFCIFFFVLTKESQRLYDALAHIIKQSQSCLGNYGYMNRNAEPMRCACKMLSEEDEHGSIANMHVSETCFLSAFALVVQYVNGQIPVGVACFLHALT